MEAATGKDNVMTVKTTVWTKDLFTVKMFPIVKLLAVAEVVRVDTTAAKA